MTHYLVCQGMRQKDLDELLTLKVKVKPQEDWTCDDWKMILMKGNARQRLDVSKMKGACLNSM